MVAALIILSIVVVGSGAFGGLAVYELYQAYDAPIPDRRRRRTLPMANRTKARWA